jgi:ligand-binding SRPBCC domain-containing protein
MVPDYIRVKILKGSDQLRNGDSIKLKIKIAGISFLWESAIVEYKENEYFMDRMIRGPFKKWEHKHYFRNSGGGTEMTDIVDYDLPLGILGYITNKLFVKKMVEDIFTFRNNYDLENFKDSKKSCDI